MIKIEPFDDIDAPCCRWIIVDYGVFHEKDLVNALRLYARELQDEAEGYGRFKKEVKKNDS
jgi:hypothetical protein